MTVNSIAPGLLAGAGGAGNLRKLQPENSPQAELEKYVKMTPAERMRDAILKQVGVTEEEELAAMSPDERQSVEQKIADLTKRQMEQQQETPQKGSFVNVAV